MKLLAQEFAKARPGLGIEVLSYIGSTGSMKAVAEGKLPLGISGRLPKPEEVDYPVTLLHYATTPMVIALHPDVPAKALSFDELAGIYAGKTLRWPDGKRIRLILRPARDSDNGHLRRMSPAMVAAVDSALSRPGLRHASTDQEAVDMIERTPGGIGGTTLALLLSEGRQARWVPIEGKAPSVEALADGSYPYAKPLYFVLPRQPEAIVSAFVEFVRSPRGAEILRANGNLPAASGAAR
jgi:phosphate transport system substrate-binding protein